MGSIIFSSLLILLFASSGPSVLGSETNTQRFFGQTLDTSSDVFNTAMQENRSIEKAKRRMYSYNRFLERKSLEKGISYRSYDIVVLPEKGEAVFINYYPTSLDTRIRINGDWNNQTVQTSQSRQFSFKSGKTDVNLVVDNLNDEHSFTASNPKLVKHSVMESGDETWENTLLG